MAKAGRTVAEEDARVWQATDHGTPEGLVHVYCNGAKHIPARYVSISYYIYI